MSQSNELNAQASKINTLLWMRYNTVFMHILHVSLFMINQFIYYELRANIQPCSHIIPMDTQLILSPKSSVCAFFFSKSWVKVMVQMSNM